MFRIIDVRRTYSVKPFDVTCQRHIVDGIETLTSIALDQTVVEEIYVVAGVAKRHGLECPVR